MSTAGRPTHYRPEYARQAQDCCLLGATNAEMADLFGVARRTIDNWIADYPEFAAAVRAGKLAADARVARGLYERAVGFRHTVERTVLHRGEERTLTSTVAYPPDTQACIFWLRNRRRETWATQRREESGVSDSELLTILDEAGERAAAAALAAAAAARAAGDD